MSGRGIVDHCASRDCALRQPPQVGVQDGRSTDRHCQAGTHRTHMQELIETCVCALSPNKLAITAEEEKAEEQERISSRSGPW